MKPVYYGQYLLVSVESIIDCGLVSRTLAPSVEVRWFKTWLGQVKDWKIGTSLLPWI